MPRTTVRDIEIQYEVAEGAGARVLFISGTGSDLRVRPNVLDSPLSNGRSVLAFDQRGLGQTTVPSLQPTMADYADDAAGLMDALGFEADAVVGASFGGMVAQELALRHPDRVPILVLCCTSSGGRGGASYPLHELADLPEAERAVRQLEISDLRMDEDWQAEHPEFVAGALERARATRAVGAGEPGRAKGIAMQLEARRGHDAYDRLRHLEMPVLVTGGRYDGIAPVANQDALVGVIDRAELRLYEGGHLFLAQNRSAWFEIGAWIDARTYERCGKARKR